MKSRMSRCLAPIAVGLLFSTCVQAQGFVFGTGQPKQDVAPATQTAVAGKDAKVEVAQRLLARLGVLKEAPSGVMTPATQEALRSFSAKQGIAQTGQVTDVTLNALRRVIWQSQNWASGNYKGREKLVDAQGLREAQILLGKLGFNAGPLDGTFGPQTQVATEAFQESLSVTVDGLITPTVLMNLRRAVAGVGSKATATVRVLNWPDYIEPSVLLDFEKETGVRVVYDVFTSNDDLQSKLRTEAVPYDVVIPTGNTVPALSDSGLLGKIDKASLKNLANLDPRVDAAIRTWDKDGNYALPYMWYTIGIAWNSKLTARAFPNRDMESLSNVFDPDVARRFQSCGVGVEDSATDIVPMAAIAGGVPKWDGKNSIAAASRVLEKLVGIVKVVPTDRFVEDLGTGKLCVVLGFSGDVVQAQNKGQGSIEYRVPTEGGLLAIDAISIPANAKNRKEAHLFVDYLLRPQVIGKISNTVGYANANLKAGEFMNESVKSNPAVVPSTASLSRAFPMPVLSEQDRQEIARVWAKFAK